MTEAGLATEGFDQLAARLRPRLHRYCARMVGSAIDGEDVVQEALTKAAGAFAQAGSIARPEGWLFQIAHRAALDALRRRRRRAVHHVDADLADVADPAAVADARIAAHASLATFMALPAAQRSSVVLADVLGYSLAETADVLGMSLAAVKAALHRARGTLKTLAGAWAPPPPGLAAAELARLRAYADRFNARDFDALRDLLAEDVRLDLVNRTRLAGRTDVSVYFHRYQERSDWRFSVGLADGRPALLGSDPADPAGAILWIVLLDWAQDRIRFIRDFKFAGYVVEGMAIFRL